MIIEVKCPYCQERFQIEVLKKELEEVKRNHDLIQRAIYHGKENIIIVVFIDWQGRIRRQHSYPIAENIGFGEGSSVIDEFTILSQGMKEKRSKQSESNKTPVRPKQNLSGLVKKIDRFIRYAYISGSFGVEYERIRAGFPNCSEREIDDAIFELLKISRVIEAKPCYYKPVMI